MLRRIAGETARAHKCSEETLGWDHRHFAQFRSIRAATKGRGFVAVLLKLLKIPFDCFADSGFYLSAFRERDAAGLNVAKEQKPTTKR